MIRIHTFIVDGTLSRIKKGEETNAGLLYKLLREKPEVSVGHDPGVQGLLVSGTWLRRSAPAANYGDRAS